MSGVQISKIKDTNLQTIAQQVDNGDGILKGKKEYNLFAEAASAQGFDSRAIGDALDMNGLQRWWYDIDRATNDGCDDGHLTKKESAKSIAKGAFVGIPKDIAEHPLEAATGAATVAGISLFAGELAVGLGLAASATPVGLAVGALIGLGIAGYTIYQGIKRNKEADNDCDAKRGMENVGKGIITTALSLAPLKGLLKNSKVKAMEVQQRAKITDEVKGYNEDGNVINTTYDENGFVIQEKSHQPGYRYSNDAYKVEKTFNTENGNITIKETRIANRRNGVGGYYEPSIEGIEAKTTLLRPDGKQLFRIDFYNGKIRDQLLGEPRNMTPYDYRVNYIPETGEGLPANSYLTLDD